MTQFHSNGRSRTEAPRRVRHGLRLKSREGPRAENWLAVRWLKLIDEVFDDEQREEGLAYAKSGQTVSLEILGGGHAGIEARVQGRAPKPYDTAVHLRALTDAQWSELIGLMAGEAVYAAKLLSGEIPPALDDLFSSLDLQLLRPQPDAIRVECTCDIASSGRPCKHGAAAALLMADRLSDDPAQIFDLHGMPNQRVLERLRQARAIQTQRSTPSSATPALPGDAIPEAQVEPPPLEASLDDFWRCGPQIAELEHAPPPQHVAHALLRRLGPSPMKGKFPLVGLLASIYDEVSAAAIHIRDRAERVEE